MKGRKRSTHNYLTPLFKKYNVKQAFISTLLILISSTAYAGLSGVKTIVISPSQLNKSGWLQVSEIIASQTGTGKDLALNSVGAVASGSPSYSKAANPSNIISGVAPDVYPRIYHSKNFDGSAWVKATLKAEAELDSITIYGRKKGDSRRDIYDISVLNTEGEIIFSKRNLSASNKSNSVSVSLTGDLSKYIQPKSIKDSTNNKVTEPGSNSSKTPKSSRQNFTEQHALALEAIKAGDLNKAEEIYNTLIQQTKGTRYERKAKKYLSRIKRKRKQSPAKTAQEGNSVKDSSLEKSLLEQAPTLSIAKLSNGSSYRFEQTRPPSSSFSRSSHSVYMHFDTLRDVALISNTIDEVVKADLLQRGRASGQTNRVKGRYSFFVNGKEIEYRNYEYRFSKGWEQVKGNTVDNRSAAQKTLKPQYSIIRSIISEAAALFDSPEKLRMLFNLGFYETVSLPPHYQFKETRKRSSSREKWYKKKKSMLKGVTYSVHASVDDFNTLVEDRDSLIKYAMSDLKQRVGKESFDDISGQYLFKSSDTQKQYLTISIRKRAGDGLTIDKSSLKLLEELANGDDEAFLQRYSMTKDMFIAEQNGDQKELAKIRKSRIEQFEKTSSGKTVELEIGSKLSKVQGLPVLYTHESRKWHSVGGMSYQAIVRKLINKYPFPMNAPLSDEEITTKKSEIADLIVTLTNKGKQLKKSGPMVKIGRYNITKYPKAKQKTLSEQFLYPGIVEIQTKIIALLSGIPRTEKGVKQAYDVNDWLRLYESEYSRSWGDLIENHSKSVRIKRMVNPMCTQLSTNEQVALDKTTGRCFFEIAYSSKLLRNAWRVQYMRDADKRLSKVIDQNGPELYHRVFQFAFDASGSWQEFNNGLPNLKIFPPNSSERCLFEDCSSRMASFFVSEGRQSVLTSKRKRQYLTTLEKKSEDLLKRWKSSGSMSKRDRYSIQADIVAYARDVAKNLLRRLSMSAAKELSKLDKNDLKGFKSWKQKVSKPLRLQAVTWRELWDIGFGIGTKENATSALGYSSGVTDSYLKARDLGGSPFVGIAEILYDAQYQWLQKSEEGTMADSNIEFPSKWSSTGSYKIPRQPKRHYAQLMAPTEIFFESIGQQVGKAIGALASYGGQIAALERRIKQSRTEFFNCLPKCSDMQIKRLAYSKVLTEKDLYFLQISGKSGSIANKGLQSMSMIIEGTTGQKGVTLVDNGIPKICYNYFNAWVSKFGKSHGREGKKEIDAMFTAFLNVSSGDFSGLKEQGFKQIQKQRDAFAKSATEYGKYQVCRDQWEFDRYAK